MALLPAYALAAACCGIAAFAKDTAAMKSRVTVELDIYSGMPNPQWPLSDDEAAQFAAMVSAAGEPVQAELHNRLGYRGFIVEMAAQGETVVIRVQDGLIHITSNGTLRRFSDRNRALERWLYETGKRHLAQEVRDEVESSL